MALSPSDRVALIHFLREKLNAMGFIDADLLTYEFGLGTLDGNAWSFTDPTEYLTNHLRSGGDADLVALAEHLGGATNRAPSVASHADGTVTAQPLVIFASHSSVYRIFVGEVAQELQFFGIELFVAHQDITPDEAWHDVILSKLDSADAGVAFLHNEFKTSDWCDQEVGWLLGRHLPVFSVRIPLAPYGPLGRWQAITGVDLSALAVAAQILQRLEARPELRAGLAASLIKAMANSFSFARTDKIWAVLRLHTDLAQTQCRDLLEALDANNQIFRANDPWSGRLYMESVPDFLRTQPGFPGLESELDAVVVHLANTT